MNFSAIEVGYIYILQNPAFSADTLKAGKTARCVYTRARELSGQTGVPEPFTVAYSGAVWDIAQAEEMLFRRLEPFRPRDCKEYFRLPSRRLSPSRKKSSLRSTSSSARLSRSGSSHGTSSSTRCASETKLRERGTKSSKITLTNLRGCMHPIHRTNSSSSSCIRGKFGT
jgi:hypothetical protein